MVAALGSSVSGGAASVYVYYFAFFGFGSQGGGSKGLLEYDPQSGLVSLVAMLLVLTVAVGVLGIAHAAHRSAVNRWLLTAISIVLAVISIVAGQSVGQYFVPSSLLALAAALLAFQRRAITE